MTAATAANKRMAATLLTLQMYCHTNAGGKSEQQNTYTIPPHVAGFGCHIVRIFCAFGSRVGNRDGLKRFVYRLIHSLDVIVHV